MSQTDIAFVREQGVSFAVVCVDDYLIDNPHEREGTYQAWTNELGMPVALMGARRHRVYGHQGIVKFVSSVHPSRLPWRRVGM